jgi:AbrB family looped-hinge helix DNA binding protein
MEEPEVAVVGTKGQIVIPHEMRTQLAIKEKTKLAVYRKGDKLVLTKLKLPTIGDELNSVFKEIDKHNKGKRAPNEASKETQGRRKEKRAGQGT